MNSHDLTYEERASDFAESPPEMSRIYEAKYSLVAVTFQRPAPQTHTGAPNHQIVPLEYHSLREGRTGCVLLECSAFSPKTKVMYCGDLNGPNVLVIEGVPASRRSRASGMDATSIKCSIRHILYVNFETESPFALDAPNSEPRHSNT